MVIWKEIGFFLGWLCGGIAVFYLLPLLWDCILLPVARRTRTNLDVLLLEALRGPARWVGLGIVWNIGRAASFRDLPAVSGHWGWGIYSGVVYIFLVISVTASACAAVKAAMRWYVSRLGDPEREKKLAPVILLLSRLANVVLAFIAATVVLGHFGVQVSGLLATAGVASLAVALAAQETLSNLFSGVALIVDRPFQPGDRIELPDGQIGDVIEIGMRTTRILTFDNTLLSIPNAEIAKSRIVNQSAPNPQYKIRLGVDVAYGTDVRKAKAILLEIVASHPDTLKSPAPAVYFSEFGESSLKLLTVFWIPDYREKFRVLDEVNMAIKDRFEAARIEIPFPQRDVHLRTGESVPSARPKVADDQSQNGDKIQPVDPQ